MSGREAGQAKVAFGSVEGFLAFGFGTGLSPFAPGTAGTLIAVPIAFGLRMLDPAVFWIVLLAAFFAGIWICEVTARRLGRHDPGGIVWDEIVAYWLTVAFLPLHWAWFLAAFVAFRFFDIVKPWPIGPAERRFKGGLGIMIDDILAAVYAMAVLQLAAVFLEGI